MTARDRELAELSRIARIGAAIVMDVYRAPFAVDMKAPGDPVTEADRRANERICNEIASAFPGEAIVAEESAPEGDEILRLTSQGRVFFVDPLDGTRDFANRTEEFAVMIGLAEAGRSALGVFALPTTGEVLAGDAGEVGSARVEAASGAVAPLRVTDLRDPKEARLIVSRSRRPRLAAPLAERLGIRTLIPCGSVGVKVARVVTGVADLYVHGGGVKSWDLCAPEAVLVAAGGRMTTADGSPIRYDRPTLAHTEGFVGSNAALHDIVLQTLAIMRSSGSA